MNHSSGRDGRDRINKKRSNYTGRKCSRLRSLSTKGSSTHSFIVGQSRTKGMLACLFTVLINRHFYCTGNFCIDRIYFPTRHVTFDRCGLTGQGLALDLKKNRRAALHVDVGYAPFASDDSVHGPSNLK